MIRTLIVDDERACRESLQHMLNHYCSGKAEVVGLADSVDSACALIESREPELVLLDISMPPSDGFEVLKRVRYHNFHVVFTTAYSEYAIRAIKMSALDYLLKPVDPEELGIALQKVMEKLEHDTHYTQHQRDRIMVPSGRTSRVLSPCEIIRLEADLKKTRLVLKNGQVILSEKCLSDCEAQLRGNPFFRVHREYLINLNEIKEYIRDKNGGWIVMTDKKVIPVAARRKKEFIDRLGS